MKTSKTVKFVTAFFISSVLIFSGCKDEKKAVSENTSSSVPAKSNTPELLRKLDKETKENLKGKNVVVILGYGYNDEASIAKITDNLSAKFGIETEEEQGLMSVFIYPDDFMTAGKARVSTLVDLLEFRNLAGLVILGAPEGMNIALSKLQDSTEDGKLSYPVLSFFSQDDVLAAEATADFVLDYAHKSDGLETEVTDFIPDFDFITLLDSAVYSVITLKEPLKGSGSLENFAANLFNGKRNVTHYIDVETGLPSINHFIFE